MSKITGNTENSIVSRKWSQKKPAQQDLNFNMSPIFMRHKVTTAFGEEYVEEYGENPHFAEDIFVRKYLQGRNVQTVLSLCCGFGRIERRIVRQLGTVERCVGVDVAAGALEVALKDAKEENLNCMSYVCADLNVWDWSSEKFDLVIAHGAFHHLKEIDAVLDGVYLCLNSGGLLFSHEYIGLPYYACSPRQLQLINAVAYLVPPELRMRKGLPFSKPKMFFRLLSNLACASSGYFDNSWPSWKKMAVRMVQQITGPQATYDFGHIVISPHDAIRNTDPSEGISAPHIVPGLKKRFDRLDIMHYGGALLEYALDNQFYKAFDPFNPLHLRTADLLWDIEQFYSNTGEIGPHNVYLVAEK